MAIAIGYYRVWFREDDSNTEAQWFKMTLRNGSIRPSIRSISREEALWWIKSRKMKDVTPGNPAGKIFESDGQPFKKAFQELPLHTRYNFIEGASLSSGTSKKCQDPDQRNGSVRRAGLLHPGRLRSQTDLAGRKYQHPVRYSSSNTPGVCPHHVQQERYCHQAPAPGRSLRG